MEAGMKNGDRNWEERDISKLLEKNLTILWQLSGESGDWKRACMWGLLAMTLTEAGHVDKGVMCGER